MVADRRDGSAVKEQSGEPYYEIETGRYYYRVFTEYYAGGTEAIGAFERSMHYSRKQVNLVMKKISVIVNMRLSFAGLRGLPGRTGNGGAFLRR